MQVAHHGLYTLHQPGGTRREYDGSIYLLPHLLMVALLVLLVVLLFRGEARPDHARLQVDGPLQRLVSQLDVGQDERVEERPVLQLHWAQRLDHFHDLQDVAMEAAQHLPGIPSLASPKLLGKEWNYWNAVLAGIMCAPLAHALVCQDMAFVQWAGVHLRDTLGARDGLGCWVGGVLLHNVIRQYDVIVGPFALCVWLGKRHAQAKTNVCLVRQQGPRARRRTLRICQALLRFADPLGLIPCGSRVRFSRFLAGFPAGASAVFVEGP